MNKIPAILLFLTMLLLLLCTTVACAEEYIVVVHKSSEINNLSATDLKRVFLGKMKNWPNGNPITIILNTKDPAHPHFSRTQLHKTPRQLTTFWRKKLYSGQSMLPIFASSTEDALSILTNNINAISYLSKGLDDSVTKRVEVFE